MNKLISLELKRNNLKSYHRAVLIIIITMLGFTYLFAAAPNLESPGVGQSMDMLLSYDFLILLSNLISMVIFSVLSAVIGAKFVVSEYFGGNAILLFSYPIAREKILNAKVLIVFSYTVITMIISQCIVFTVFFVTESIFPICPDILNFQVIITAIIALICNALLAGLLGIISLWFGYKKKSISASIVSSCIIATVICQIMSMTFLYSPMLIIILALVAVTALFMLSNVHREIKSLEV